MPVHAPGTSIDGELLRQFAVATGASVSLHDLSVKSLAAEYDPYMDIRECHMITETLFEMMTSLRG